jgi:enoyl-CoA hydratase
MFSGFFAEERGDRMIVDCQLHGHIGVITMQDDAKRNAMSRQLVDGVHAAMDSAISQGARALVLASQARVFCAGGDLSGLLAAKALNENNGRVSYEDFITLDLSERLASCPFPVIAAVDGAALGGGFGLALCCDAIVASSRATFGLPETGIGLAPTVALALLPSLIGRTATFELALTGRRLTAQQANSLGFISRLVESAVLMETAIELARSMVSKAPPAAIATVKRLLARDSLIEWKEMIGAWDSLSVPEWKEGLNAFLEKRPPDYSRFWSDKSRTALLRKR